MSTPTYEMLWDCVYCGTRKLLGKTHRFCPACGAPQDPGRRYFPPEGEEVAVEGHVYVGADRTCEACGCAMSAAAAHCSQCGSALEGAAEVRRLEDRPTPGGAVQAAEPAPAAAALLSSVRPPGPRYLHMAAIGCGTLALVAVVALVVALIWRTQESVVVIGHAWERSIAVEALAARHEAAWCDQMPAGAYGVSRRREVRSHRQIPDGQDCKNRRVDQGDGTFRVERECTPRYRKEPVYADRCSFTIDRWEPIRTARAQGADVAARWPDVGLARPGTCRGCDRLGQRTEAYRVAFRGGDGSSFECALPEARWRGIEEGSRFVVSKSAVTGSAFCGTLKPLP